MVKTKVRELNTNVALSAIYGVIAVVQLFCSLVLHFGHQSFWVACKCISSEQTLNEKT